MGRPSMTASRSSSKRIARRSIFANTRAYGGARHRAISAERLGEANVAAHHGSLAKRTAVRRRATARKRARSRCWWPPPRSSSASTSATSSSCASARLAALHLHLPAARRPRQPLRDRRAERRALFPAVAMSLIECVALLDAVRRGELDRLQHSTTIRSTCWRSRSSPSLRQASMARTSCSRW